MRKNVRKYARVEGTEHLVDNFQYAAKPRTSPSERVANQSENRQPPPLPISERQALASKNEIYGKDIHEDLQGTRLAYHLKQLANQFRNTQHHDLSVMAEKALSGDFGANGRKSDVFQDIGKKLKSIKHEMGSAYNWHKIVPALAVDGAIRKAITSFARVKNPENEKHKFRLIAKSFGHQGYEKDESGEKMVGLVSNSEKSQKAWNIFRAAAAEAAKSLRLNKSHITDEMINRSLQRLAMKEEYAEADRTRVTKQLPQAKIEKKHPTTGEPMQVLEPRGKQFTWHDAMGILPAKVGENSNPEQYRRKVRKYSRLEPHELANHPELHQLLNGLDDLHGNSQPQFIPVKWHDSPDASTHHKIIADWLEEHGHEGVAKSLRSGSVISSSMPLETGKKYYENGSVELDPSRKFSIFHIPSSDRLIRFHVTHPSHKDHLEVASQMVNDGFRINSPSPENAIRQIKNLASREQSQPERLSRTPQQRNLNVRGRRPIQYAASHEEVATSHDLGAMLNALDHDVDYNKLGTGVSFNHKDVDPSHYGAMADHIEEQGMPGVAHFIRHGTRRGDWEFESSSFLNRNLGDRDIDEEPITAIGHPHHSPLAMTHVGRTTALHILNNGKVYNFYIRVPIDNPAKSVELIESLQGDNITSLLPYREKHTNDELSRLKDATRRSSSQKMSRRKGNLNVRGVE